MPTPLSQHHPSHSKLTTKREVREMKAAHPKAVVAVMVVALLGIGSQALAETSKKKGPINKSATYTLILLNNTGSDITMTRTASHCMHDAGPASYTVRNGVPGYFNITDSNAFGSDCTNAWKNVMWNLSTGSTLQWRHEIQAGSWQTQVQGNVKSAECDGQNCLAPAYVGNDHTTPVAITF
ncbi:hypothetical protein N5J06_02000 [Ralstonia sp. CHL-2022]|uniref:Uncharacterized protein n=1 Tax=Ralstonia mojiangensis TaxID=2953895 RepID=A0ABT2L399_9RALS|nr:hypothetical protein [Ralstonia mojiangensis]MCT7309704.1 hypothetical protein [Ralstonia mojiangensis]